MIRSTPGSSGSGNIDAGVDDDGGVSTRDRHHVHAELAEAAERHHVDWQAPRTGAAAHGHTHARSQPGRALHAPGNTERGSRGLVASRQGRLLRPLGAPVETRRVSSETIAQLQLPARQILAIWSDLWPRRRRTGPRIPPGRSVSGRRRPSMPALARARRPAIDADRPRQTASGRCAGLAALGEHASGPSARSPSIVRNRHRGRPERQPDDGRLTPAAPAGTPPAAAEQDARHVGVHARSRIASTP